MEILYVGQSYGKNGDRNAVNRLLEHSTLQQILAEINVNEPDKDVVVSLWDFVPKLLPVMDGISKNYQTSNDVDNSHIMNVLNNDFDYKQMINITEAALINFFKPKYNEKFANNFPDYKHSSYTEYYNLDFNSLIVELWQDDLNSRLFTDTNEYRVYDFIQYRLHPENERKSMFDIFK